MARPRKYQSVEQLQAAIDAYFDKCNGHMLTDDNGAPKYDKFGHPIIIDRVPPTVTGLALALGFAGRQALLNQETYSDEFKDTILRAKARIEAYAEARLFDRDGVNGAKFTLERNFGWRQEREDRDVIFITSIDRGDTDAKD